MRGYIPHTRRRGCRFQSVARKDKHHLSISVSKFSERGRNLLSATWSVNEIEGLMVDKCRPAELRKRRADGEVDYRFEPPAAWKVHSRDTLPFPNPRWPASSAMATRIANKLKSMRFASLEEALWAIELELLRGS